MALAKYNSIGILTDLAGKPAEHIKLYEKALGVQA